MPTSNENRGNLARQGSNADRGQQVTYREAEEQVQNPSADSGSQAVSEAKAAAAKAQASADLANARLDRFRINGRSVSGSGDQGIMIDITAELNDADAGGSFPVNTIETCIAGEPFLLQGQFVLTPL